MCCVSKTGEDDKRGVIDNLLGILGRLHYRGHRASCLSRRPFLAQPCSLFALKMLNGFLVNGIAEAAQLKFLQRYAIRI